MSDSNPFTMLHQKNDVDELHAEVRRPHGIENLIDDAKEQSEHTHADQNSTSSEARIEVADMKHTDRRIFPQSLLRSASRTGGRIRMPVRMTGLSGQSARGNKRV